MARPIAAVGREVESVGPHYVEAIRRQLLHRYGDKLLHEGGLRVEVAMDAGMQKAAQAAVARGLEALERKRGLLPPQHVLHPEAWQAMRSKFVASAGEKPLRALPVGEPISLEEASSAAGGDMKERAGEAADEAQTEVAPPVVGWDFARLPLADLARLCAGQDVAFDEASRAFAASWGSKIARQRLEPGVTLVAPLKSVDERALRVDLGGAIGRVDRASLGWARLGPKTPLPVGGLYRVRVLAEHPRPSKKARRLSEEEARQVPLELVPLPTVQAALVAIEPVTRRVLALDGGYDFASSQFNRATQARRQPGSSFKPIVYGAALESGRFTLASVLNDAPDLHRDPWTGKQWRPQNYERDVYEGPMSLRTALAKSKNTVSVRLIEAIGPEAAIDFARRVGIASPLPGNLTLALGTGEVTPLELANAYATFAAMGKSAEPTFLLSVRDKNDALLERASAVGEEVVSPGVAFLVTSMMQSVVEEGTGRRAAELGRPVAGKTGTASENRDAWFVGFTPGLVAVVWVGRDNHKPLGRGGTGASVALPIWLDFMRAALEGSPVVAFSRPDDIEEVRVDPQSGGRVSPESIAAAGDTPPGRLEFFVSGTAPEEIATPEGEADPRFFLLEESAVSP